MKSDLEGRWQMADGRRFEECGKGRRCGPDMRKKERKSS
jgi:hypothetical protein